VSTLAPYISDSRTQAIQQVKSQDINAIELIPENNGQTFVLIPVQPVQNVQPVQFHLLIRPTHTDHSIQSGQSVRPTNAFQSIRQYGSIRPTPAQPVESVQPAQLVNYSSQPIRPALQGQNRTTVPNGENPLYVNPK